MYSYLTESPLLQKFLRAQVIESCNSDRVFTPTQTVLEARLGKVSRSGGSSKIAREKCCVQYLATDPYEQ